MDAMDMGMNTYLEKVVMDWETESHTFILNKADRLSLLDFLGDHMKTLEGLYNYLVSQDDYDEDEDGITKWDWLDNRMFIVGGCGGIKSINGKSV